MCGEALKRGIAFQGFAAYGIHAKNLAGDADALIRELGERSEKYVQNPGRDFTRKRVLTFGTVISLLLAMSGNSVGKVLMSRFKNSARTRPFVDTAFCLWTAHR